MIKFVTAVAASLFFFAAPALAQDINNKFPGYRLEYNEEFSDPTTLDRNFNFENGYCRNHENQYYRRQNAWVENGNLVIMAESGADEWTDRDNGVHMSFYSASVKSNRRFHYGIWETRAKAPIGSGLWPAIWGTGDSRGWPSAGEIDVMEYYGDNIHANVCWGDHWQYPIWESSLHHMSTFSSDFADVYHTWRMEWDHNSIRIYLDDRLLKEVKLSQTVNGDGYNPYRDENNKFDIWLNLAIGGDNGGDFSAISKAFYYIDYTRVYVPEDANAALTYRIHKAQQLLDNNPNASASRRNALSEAIDEARKFMGRDQDAIDGALDALQAAMDAFPAQAADESPIPLGRPFSLRHSYTGALLASGWFQAPEDEDTYAKNSLLVIDDNSLGDYNASFILDQAPAATAGFNLHTPDGQYVYRDRWYLLLKEAPTTDELNSPAFLFSAHAAGDGIVIRSAMDGKYFATDNNWSWSRVYGDKANDEKALFSINYIGHHPSGINPGEEYMLLHNYTGSLLSAGFFQADEDEDKWPKKSLLVIHPDDKENAVPYAQAFTFLYAPAAAPDHSYYNLRTSDGDYVYRDRWYLLVTDSEPSQAQLASEAFLFRPEAVGDGNIVIRGMLNWQDKFYFATDNNLSWSRMYGDKDPDEKAYFSIYKSGQTAIGDIAADNITVTTVPGGITVAHAGGPVSLDLYSLAGSKAASARTATLSTAGLPHGIYILCVTTPTASHRIKIRL